MHIRGPFGVLGGVARAATGRHASKPSRKDDLVGQVDRGTGKLLQRGDEHIAVFHGRDGTLSALDARCPHRGCLVDFNLETGTWDCPWHRARFATDGSVIDGKGLVSEPLTAYPLAG